MPVAVSVQGWLWQPGLTLCGDEVQVLQRLVLKGCNGFVVLQLLWQVAQCVRQLLCLQYVHEGYTIVASQSMIAN